ncbi:hypothetical protein ACFL4W_05720 [Planctomycetota bacterium]
MVWNDAPDREGVTVERHALPPGFRDNKHQALMGVGLSLPEVKYTEDTPAGATAAVVRTVGERSWQRDISPAHRKIVREFFTEEGDR